MKQGTLLFNDLFPESNPEYMGYGALTRPVSVEGILDFRSSLVDVGHKCGTDWVINPTLEANDKSGLLSFLCKTFCIKTSSLLKRN